MLVFLRAFTRLLLLALLTGFAAQSPVLVSKPPPTTVNPWQMLTDLMRDGDVGKAASLEETRL
ncbi:hypothetical protein [Pseudomonas putida]|uniref:hypothetical protein n=1 Tax=Pseudomonas putida TaxID=303 RepID=UPI002366F7B5|nr:hypothetical protein [Pseudomonas putida]MDD2050674.1 hypothetical protein [Pseudomonas putida]